MRGLEYERGKGRDDSSLRAVWNSWLAGLVLHHPAIESLVRNLQRNGPRVIMWISTWGPPPPSV